MQIKDDDDEGEEGQIYRRMKKALDGAQSSQSSSQVTHSVTGSSVTSALGHKGGGARQYF